MAVSTLVDAYPNRPFQGRVLKIEPLAITQQNVTMFPVLVRIANREGLLKPGMNAEVEMQVGDRRGVLAVPNGALRTQRDVASAATVLGLDPEGVEQELARAREAAGGQASLGGTTAGDSTAPNVYRTRDGREITLPEGITSQQVDAIFAKMRNGGPSALSEADRAVFQKMRAAMGGGGFGGGGGPSGPSRSSANQALFGGSYIVFVLRNGSPTPVSIETGLTDLDYSEVRSGLTAQDTVLILPSASLVEAQEEMRNRMNRMTTVPGMQRQTTAPTGPPGRGSR